MTQQIKELNQLLSAAKEAEVVYRNAYFRRLEGQDNADRLAVNAWLALYDAMRLVGKFNIIDEDGKVREIRVVGAMVNFNWLNYSNLEDARDTFKRIDLMQTSSIEEAT